MSSVLLLAAFFFFGVLPSSLPVLIMAVFSSSLVFVGMMMLLSVLGKTEQSAGNIGWAVLLIFTMLGGGMIPLFVMPSWMISLSHFSPVKWAILAVEGALWRQFTVQEMLLPCGILIGVGSLFFIVGLRMFQWSAE